MTDRHCPGHEYMCPKTGSFELGAVTGALALDEAIAVVVTGAAGALGLLVGLISLCSF